MMNIQYEERSRCPICGSTERSVFLPFPQIPVVRCSQCAFKYSARLISEKTCHEFENRFGVKLLDESRQLFGQRIAARLNCAVARSMINMKQIGSMLDVGTGYGLFLHEMKARFPGIKTVGVEPSADRARYAHERLGVDIKNKYLAEAGFAPGSFDLVTCFEVIEHVPLPRPFLRELFAPLRTGGLLLIGTDNFECHLVDALGPGFPKWIPYAHVCHFGPSSFETIIAETGFKIVRRFSFSSWEYIARWIVLKVTGNRVSAEKAFDLSRFEKMSNEGAVPKFRFRGIRSIVNIPFARLTSRRNLSGASMYILAQKTE